MKLKIKVKVLEPGCMPVISKKGDWIDLRAAKDIDNLIAPQAGVQYTENGERYRDVHLLTTYIPLGVAMQLPKGFEAIVASRSSTPKKLKVFIPNGIGVIDNTYQGDNDEWQFVSSAMSHTAIKKGDRVCQFRIQLSQHATIWQKLKWLFSSGVELVEVPSLKNPNRGGLGSTGIY